MGASAQATVWVFLAALATALATGLGAAPFLFARDMGRQWLGFANAIAAGVMVGASIGLCIEGFEFSGPRTVAGGAAGALALFLAHRALGHQRDIRVGSLRGADARKALLVVGAMTAHSFAEGVGVGVAFGGGETLGVLITIAIAVHNVPEGLAISLVLVPRGARVRTAAGWSVFSSLPQPLVATPAFLFVEAFAGFLPVGLGFAAGAMLWLVAAELLPEAVRSTRPLTVAVVAVASAGAMLGFQLALL